MKYTGKIIGKSRHDSMMEEENAFEITNKYKDSKIEINIYVMYKGHSFFFRPPDNKMSTKTYYILEGELFNLDTGKHYTTGDIIVLQDFNEPFNFTVEENLKTLVQSIYDNSFEKSRNLYHLINDTLAKIQLKDAYTSEHSSRVYKLAKLMALELNYSGKSLLNLLYAAQYHDIGKIYIEDKILSKPSLLSEEEYEIMKSHVTAGEEILTSNFNMDTYKIVSQHHERIDGSGYPYGLKADEITEEGKIIAICDSYDAMTTDRVYKRGKTVEEAIIELKELGGIKYDLKLIRIFTEKVLPQYIKISSP